MRYALLLLLVAGCFEATDVENDRGDGAYLTLTKNADGQLEYCDEHDDCRTFDNPDGCDQLVIDIEVATGSACETCSDAEGEIIRQGCDGASVACTVKTEPACVVCAYYEGPIIYSNCDTAPPATCDTISSLECEICYDADGNVVSDGCGQDCSTTVCPQILCAEGYLPLQRPGECCAQCYQQTDCSGVDCAEAELPSCPPGTAPSLDPTSCCGYWCEAQTCDAVACPDIAIFCPEGYELDTTFPNCCGACVPSDDARYCFSTDECEVGEICTTETGDCLSACGPDSNIDTDGSCIEACMGVCRPHAWTCGDVAIPETLCEGTWQTSRDEYGCPLPPTCVCADGTITLDGFCQDACGQVECLWQPTCELGYHLETGYPYCCGACVPDAECWTGQAQGVQCGDVFCTDVQHQELGPSCCPICADNRTLCMSSQECAVGESCTTEQGACDLPPECPTDMQCVTACYGECVVSGEPALP